MSKIIEQEMMAKLLFDKYGKVTLTPVEAAAVLGTAVKTLEADRANAAGIPFTRRNNKEKGQVMYSIVAIARTLVDNETKII